jgi:uncharacterized protein
MVMRFDTAQLRLDGKRTPQGFLRADAIIARTGVQTYKRADGSLQREYRPPSTVFHPDALNSFSLAPLTLGHPPVPVSAQNAKVYAVGTTGEIVARKDSKYVATKVLITDPAAIEAVERGDARELSCGYECDLDMRPGISPEGERYDAVQTAIRGNHVAILAHGRAGPEVRLQLDADDHPLKLDRNDAVQVEHDRPHFQYGGDRFMIRGKVPVRIDGAEFRVRPRVAQALSKLEQLHVDELSAAKSKITALQDEVEKLRGELDKAKVKTQQNVSAGGRFGRGDLDSEARQDARRKERETRERMKVEHRDAWKETLKSGTLQ